MKMTKTWQYLGLFQEKFFSVVKSKVQASEAPGQH